MSPPCLWLVDRNVRPDTLARIEQACNANDNDLLTISVDRGSVRPLADVTALPPDQPFILYGYASLLTAAASDPTWRRGVFFDAAAFRPSVYLANWGPSRMLNQDAVRTTIGEFLDPAAADETLWFVRPDDDLKSFPGGLVSRATLAARIAEERGGPPPSTAPILVARPKTFGHEWRLFIVDNGVVASSCYTNEGRDRAVPPEVETFAIQAARSWSPAPAFALDVTIDETGAPRIIEANCVNGSGFYLADVSSIVHALSRYQELTWLD